MPTPAGAARRRRACGRVQYGDMYAAIGSTARATSRDGMGAGAPRREPGVGDGPTASELRPLPPLKLERPACLLREPWICWPSVRRAAAPRARAHVPGRARPPRARRPDRPRAFPRRRRQARLARQHQEWTTTRR